MADRAYLMPPMAAKLYALTLALQDRRCANPASLIRQGQLLVKAAHEHGTKLPPGRESVYLRDAASAFMRAWAEHDPENAADILDGAERLRLVNEFDLLIAETGGLPGPEAAA